MIERAETAGPEQRRQADRGQATAELAVGLPSLFAAFFVAAWLLGAVSGQARCADAARVGARLAARGESDPTVTLAVARAAPPHARIRLRRHEGLLDVEVSARISRAGLDSFVPDLVVSARAVVPDEAAFVEPPPAEAATPPFGGAPAEPPDCPAAPCGDAGPP